MRFLKYKRDLKDYIAIMNFYLVLKHILMLTIGKVFIIGVKQILVVHNIKDCVWIQNNYHRKECHNYVHKMIDFIIFNMVIYMGVDLLIYLE